jgi:hypothetical protein
MYPNYRNWQPKLLKEIIKKCDDQVIVYFDNQVRNNMQNKYFAKAELYEQKNWRKIK